MFAPRFMKKNSGSVVPALLILPCVLALAPVTHAQSSGQGGAAPAAAAQPATPAAMDKLLAPIALYPDALILQIVQCAATPFEVKQVSEWLKQNPTLKGTAAQDAAAKQGFDASFVALVLFPQVLQMMADKPDWTRDLGQAFVTDKSAVFASIQRLRTQAQAMGNLASNEQQQVSTTTTASGQQVIVVQPANPQVVYVPQYNPQVVYVQSAPPPSQTSTTSAAVVGFTAGVIVGAVIADNNSYHYSSCWGYQGAALCNEGYNNYYQHQEAMAAQSGQNQANRQSASASNQENRQSTSSANQASRQSAAESGQQNAAANQASRQSAASTTTSANQASRQSAAESGQQNASANQASRQSAAASQGGEGSRSGGASSYQSGSSERAASSRGSSSMSRSSGSRSYSGGGRSR